MATDASRHGRLSSAPRLRRSGVHREIVLLAILICVAIVAFSVTRVVARGNEALRRSQAAAWFDTGQRRLRDGDTARAVADLRRATSRDPANRAYRLALADALVVSRHDDEARRVLLGLRETQPEDPQTNLQLARLETSGPDVDVTRRYYQNAVAGLWGPEMYEQRRNVRIELIRFLMAHGQRDRAVSELVVLGANMPENAKAETEAEVGRLFLAAGDPHRALDHFVAALRSSANNPDALSGAGEAAFELGDYRRARRYLSAAPRGDSHLDELRELADLVLASDPLAPRLTPAERRKRLLTNLAHATERVDTCLAEASGDPGAAIASLRDEARTVAASIAAAHSADPGDVIDDGADLVYRMERATERTCRTPPAPLDRALLLIGRQRGFEEQ